MWTGPAAQTQELSPDAGCMIKYTVDATASEASEGPALAYADIEENTRLGRAADFTRGGGACTRTVSSRSPNRWTAAFHVTDLTTPLHGLPMRPWLRDLRLGRHVAPPRTRRENT